MCLEASHTRLKAFCLTPWEERHNALLVFIELYFPLFQVLSDLEQYSLLNAVTAAPFIVTVHILREILRVTKALSDTLQSSNLDLVKAINHKHSVLHRLIIRPPFEGQVLLFHKKIILRGRQKMAKSPPCRHCEQ